MRGDFVLFLASVNFFVFSLLLVKVLLELLLVGLHRREELILQILYAVELIFVVCEAPHDPHMLVKAQDGLDFVEEEVRVGDLSVDAVSHGSIDLHLVLQLLGQVPL